jgi:hypothetical protein
MPSLHDSLQVWHKRKNTQTMTTTTRQFGDTHLLWTAKGPDGEITSAHTGLQWGQWHHLHRTSLAETDFDHRAHSLDGAQCYSHLAIMSSLLKYVFCKRNEKKFKCFHLSLLFYILRQCLLQPLSQYAAKASFELLLLVPLPPLCLGLQVCATMPGTYAFKSSPESKQIMVSWMWGGMPQPLEVETGRLEVQGHSLLCREAWDISMVHETLIQTAKIKGSKSSHKVTYHLEPYIV